METIQSLGGDEQFLRRYEYEDRWVVAVDLPVADDAVDVDVIGSTAILVVDVDGRVDQGEIELPGPAARIETNNGVLTLEVEK